MYLSIHHFSTSYTDDAVFIIGGFNNEKTVAEYKNGQWSKVGELKDLRMFPYALKFGKQTVILDLSSQDVEVWDFERRQILTTFKRPYSREYFAMEGFAMFLIQNNFCN